MEWIISALHYVHEKNQNDRWKGFCLNGVQSLIMVGTTDTITGATRAGVESLAMWPPQLPVSQWCVLWNWDRVAVIYMI